MKRCSSLFVAFVCVCAGVARAQLPAARLSTVFPPGGQQGTSVEVTVAGTDLDELATLHFSTPSISAQPKIDPATGQPVPNVFIARISKDLRPGAYDVRAAGRFGVTNPRAFVVDRDPQIVAKPGNASPQTAADLSVNSAAYSIPAANASQYFKLNLKAAQSVFIETDAAAIDSRFEPVLVLFDAAGREIARDGRGELIAFTAASDGAYIVEVHDMLYRGGPEYFYRLRIHDRPRVDAALPAAVWNGDPVELTLLGRSLKQKTLSLDDASLPENAAELVSRWFLRAPAGLLDGAQRYEFAGGVNPLFVARATAPLIAEQADNDEPAKAQAVATPVEVFGQFFPRNDRDWVQFEAKKGEAYWIEVISSRTTNLTDPVVLVQRVTNAGKPEETSVDAKEAYDPENVAAMPREFPAGHRDPAFVFAAPEDGTYRVLVRDLFNQSEDDPRRVYRLSIAPISQRQDFRLVALPQAPQPIRPDPTTTQLWGSNLRPGGVMPVKVVAIRTAGFGGDITLTAEGLPAGVTCPPVVLNIHMSTATLLLVAAENAPPFVGPIRVVGTAKLGEQSLSHAARAGTVVWPVGNADTDPMLSRVAQQVVIAVTAGELEPITVRPAEEKLWEDSIAGKLEIPLKVTRRAGYNAAVKLKLAGGATVLTDQPEFEIAAAASEGKLVIDAGAMKLPPGVYCVYLQTTSVAPYDRDPVKRAAVQASKDAADKATPELAGAVMKAKEAAAAAATPELKESTAKLLAAAEEQVKQNEQSKAALTEQLKALAPKDTTAYGYSTPITFKLTPAPITLAAAAPATPIKPGGKLDVPVTITRLYGFADVVDLSVVIPQGVAGLSVANVQLAADAAAQTVSVVAAADAVPGDYTLTLVASIKQNNIPLKVEQPLRVQVVAP